MTRLWLCSLLLAASLAGPALAQPQSNELLRRAACEQVLASQPGTQDWAEALLLLQPSSIDLHFIQQELVKLPPSAEVLLLRGRLTLTTPEGEAALRASYQKASGIERCRAAVWLARVEARLNHMPEAMKLLAQAQHGAQQIDQTWLWYELAQAQCEVHSHETPSQLDWETLLLLRPPPTPSPCVPGHLQRQPGATQV